MVLFQSFRRLRLCLTCLWLLAAFLLLGGCKEKDEEEDGPSMASSDSYNHTADHIGRFYIDGTWAGNSRAYIGGSGVCCIGYPKVWRPGLTATVRWTTSSAIPGDPLILTWRELVVPIERYERGGDLLVHFLPDYKVRLLIWPGTAESPGYPGPGVPIKPADWPPKIKED